MGERLDVEQARFKPRCDELFHGIEAKFRLPHIPNDKWYLTALSSLTTMPEPHLADQLYLYLVKQPESSTPLAHQAVI